MDQTTRHTIAHGVLVVGIDCGCGRTRFIIDQIRSDDIRLNH
jgi:hypothetical protein